MGRRIMSTFEVVEFTPGSKIVIETMQSTFPIRVERSVEPTGPSSCRITANITGGPSVPRFTEGFFRLLAQRSVTADYDRLVDLLATDVDA